MKVKSKPGDFRVFEVLKEKPSKKDGKYRYYTLFKRGIETKEAIGRVAKLSRVSPEEILYGGLKDKNAETTQFIAVRRSLKLKEIRDKNLRLCFVGYLDRPPKELIEGNRFEVLVRGVREVPEERFRVLEDLGIPNYYGEQRFTPVRDGRFFVQELLKGPKCAVVYLFTPAGWESSLSRRAKKLFIQGKFKEASSLFRGWRKKVSDFLSRGGSFEEALKLVPKEEVEFQLNVFQSYLFNRLLSDLIEGKTPNLVKFKYKLGYLYYPLESVSVPVELPAFTPKLGLYDSLISQIGVDRKSLLHLSDYFHSFKRKAFVKPKDFEIEEVSKGSYLLKFFLPSGSYATNLLRFLFSAV